MQNLDTEVNRRGFTFIEILVTLAVFGILFVPVMQLFSQGLDATGHSKALLTAVNLARWEAERTRNLGSDVRRLKKEGNVIWPPPEEPPISLNGTLWRIHRTLKPESDPVEVTIEVNREGETKPMTILVLLICDPVWTRQTQAQ